MTQSTIAYAALAYARRGWRSIPSNARLRRPSARAGKSDHSRPKQSKARDKMSGSSLVRCRVGDALYECVLIQQVSEIIPKQEELNERS
jgi:hypothetical protein